MHCTRPYCACAKGGPLAAPFLSYISALFLFPLICYFFFQINPTLCLADPVVDVNRVESDYLGIMFLCKVCISNYDLSFYF